MWNQTQETIDLRTTLAIGILALMIVLATPLQAQTLKVIYNFTGGADGESPYLLTIDRAGNLYGTTTGDSNTGPYGNVFKLAPSSGGWIYTSLHEFNDGADGGYPYSSPVMDANGNLYGTATVGGNQSDCGGLGCGVIWEITP